MVSQHAEMLRQAVGVHLLDGFADAGVLRPPLGLGLALYATSWVSACLNT